MRILYAIFFETEENKSLSSKNQISENKKQGPQKKFSPLVKTAEELSHVTNPDAPLLVKLRP